MNAIDLWNNIKYNFYNIWWYNNIYILAYKEVLKAIVCRGGKATPIYHSYDIRRNFRSINLIHLSNKVYVIEEVEISSNGEHYLWVYF